MKRVEKEKILSNVHFSAKRLLGSYLIRKIGNNKLVGKITETEIYHEGDPASHSCNGRTKRCEVMFGSPGLSYVYLVYGMYHCFNIVCGKRDEGSAILIRSLEPIKGIKTMKKYRNTSDIKNLTNGPGKLCQAMHITRDLNKIDLLNKKSPIYIKFNDQVNDKDVINTTRIGISKGKDKKYRYCIRNNPFISSKL